MDERNHDIRVAERDLPPRLANDQFYRALAAPQRRRLLYYLLAENESTVEELATVLCGWNATDIETMRTPADWESVHLSLVHKHLPRLAETGLIDYDPTGESVQIASLHPRVTETIRESVEAEQHTQP